MEHRSLLKLSECPVLGRGHLLLFGHELAGLHGLQHIRLPCPSLSMGVCSDSCPLSR